MPEKTHNATAAFTIKAGSLEATQQNSQGVESFFLEEHIDMVGLAQITLRPNQNVDFDSFKVGDEVSIKVSGDAREWKGFITGFRITLEGNEPKLTILAMDALCKLASSRHTRVWPPEGNPSASSTIKDDAIVNEVLGAAGVDAGDVQTGVESKYVFQRNESDLNFLKRLASRNGYVLRVVEGKVNFEKLPTGGDVVEFDYKTAKALEYSWSPMWLPPKLKVHGYDYATKTAINGEHAALTPIGDGDDGIAAGNKKIWQAESHISDVIVTADSAAKAIAEAELERLGRNFLRGRAIIDGSGEVYPGRGITFTGMDSAKPKGVVISARHIVTTKPEDFRTEITFASNTAPS